MNASVLHKTNPEFESAQQAEVVDRVQRVAMDQSELSLYIQDGMPTGLLFRSVACLKGMNSKVIAAKAKVPPGVVKVVLQEGATSSVKTSAVIAISLALGIDLRGMCLITTQAHTFDMRLIPLMAGEAARRRTIRAAGLLMRGAVVTTLNVATGSTIDPAKWFVEYHLAQSGGSRAVFINSKIPLFGRPFKSASIPSSRWLSGNANLRVKVDSLELGSQLKAKDVNRLEFDQIFSGADATTWDDIRTCSREHNVSRFEILEMIKSAAGATSEEVVELEEPSPPPALRLVHVVARSTT